MVPTATKHLNHLGSEIKWLGDLDAPDPDKPAHRTRESNDQALTIHDYSDPRSREGEGIQGANPDMLEAMSDENEADVGNRMEMPIDSINDNITVPEGDDDNTPGGIR